MAFGLTAFDLTIITRRLELPEISPDPAAPLTLIVRFCGAGNRVWESLQFQRAAARAADAGGAESNDDSIKENTALSSLIAATAIVGWEHVVEDGQLAVFTEDGAERFMAELLEHCPDVWRRAATYVVDRGNFRGKAAAPDAGALGKG